VASARKQAVIHTDTHFGAADSAALRLSGARFEDCSFERCELRERDLRGARFVDCSFVATDAALATVIDCALVRVRFRECRLSGINWSVANKLESVTFDECQIDDAVFSGLSLHECAFTRCMVRRAAFRETNLSKVSFRGSTLTGAEFVHSDLRGADFREAVDYTLNPSENRVEGARFSLPDAVTLLAGLGVIIE
jgi:uncharacterized protein YjbI with pentapeptide repeats